MMKPLGLRFARDNLLTNDRPRNFRKIGEQLGNKGFKESFVGALHNGSQRTGQGECCCTTHL